VIAVVLAGAAAGADIPGPLAPLAGKPLIEHSVAAFHAAAGVAEILVAVPPPLAARTRQLLAGYAKVSRVTGGGATWTESARRAVLALGAAEGSVLLHDAARPLIGQRVIADCVTALASHQAVCAAVPAADTMVAVVKDLITERPSRDRLRRRQTPQGFRLPVIRRACELAAADPAFADTDPCGIVLRYLPEVPVRLVAGSAESFAITRPADLGIAATLLAALA
jgi:2-C-methyl-D-erythritol 4-phosphate cytidylyltransferase